MSIKWSWFLLLAFVSQYFAAQQPSATTTTYYPAHPIDSSKISSQLTKQSMASMAPLFIQEGTITSSLVLVNNSSEKAGATITVRNLAGQTVTTQHVVLDGSSQKELSVDSLLVGAGQRPHLGNICVLQDSGLVGAVINAQLLITDRRNSIPAGIDEELLMPFDEAAGPALLRGVSDDAQASPLIAITNTTDQLQSVNIRCLDVVIAAVTSTNVEIEPHATSFTAGCYKEQIDNLNAYLANFKPRETSGPIGVEVKSASAPGSLAAFALTPHLRNQTVVLGAVSFEDPRRLRSNTVIYTGVPFGQQLTSLNGSYVPHVSLANFSPKPISVKITSLHSQSRYLADTQPQLDAQPQTDSKQVTLHANEVRDIALENQGAYLGLLHSIRVESDGVPGDLQSKVVARGVGNLYEIEMLGKDLLNSDNAGGHPWTTAGDYNSDLLLFNHALKSTSFNIYIASGKQFWHKTYVLAPNETRIFSINQIISSGLKDDTGNVLSTDSTNGVVFWSPGDPELGSGRLLVSSVSDGVARNYSCGYTVIVCGMGLSVYGYGVIPIFGFALFGQMNPQYCLTWGPGVCNGTPAGGGGASYYWTIDNTSIANFNSPGDQYSNAPYFYGVNDGSTTSTAFASENGCQSYGPANPPPTTCRATVVPTEFSGSCDGLQTKGFQANISPSISQCVYSSNGSNCSASSASGAVDVQGVDKYLEASPNCSVRYFAGPGSGTVGTMQLNFTLTIGAYTVSPSQIANVKCP